MDDSDKTSKKLKVFLSYSRDDLSQTQQLFTLLETSQQFEPTMDLEGISAGEDWHPRLERMILENDVVVFMLSPSSVCSDICRWEVDEALRRGKKIIPVLARPLDDAKPHEALAGKNYIFIYEEEAKPGSNFANGFVELTKALLQDVEWLREHRRLEELANRWNENERLGDFLIRGSELQSFIGWRNRRPDNAPELTALQGQFIGAAEDAEHARHNSERLRLEEMAVIQNEQAAAFKMAEQAQKEKVAATHRLGRITVIGLIVVTLLFFLTSLIGYFAYTQSKIAQEQKKAAIAEKAKADERLRQVNVSVIK